MNKLLIGLTAALLVLGVPTAYGDGGDGGSGFYEIRVTNITRGQSFTPIMVAAAKPRRD